MAGDWIKWVKGLPRKPEVVRLAGMLSLSRAEVVSRLMTFWEWCDDNIPDDAIRENGSAFVELSPHDGDNMAFVDDLVCTSQFANSLALVKWIHFRDGRIELPNFGRHNGETAKTRARNARNQKKKRDKSPDDSSKSVTTTQTVMSPPRGDKSVTREREEENRTSNTNADTPISPQGGVTDDAETGVDVTPKRVSVRTAAFERWYAVYPKRVGPEQAAKAFQAAMKRIAPRHSDREAALEWLMLVTADFALSPKGRGEFCWNPASFLNQGHYDDDQQQWQRGDGTDKAISSGPGQVHPDDNKGW